MTFRVRVKVNIRARVKVRIRVKVSVKIRVKIMVRLRGRVKVIHPCHPKEAAIMKLVPIYNIMAIQKTLLYKNVQFGLSALGLTFDLSHLPYLTKSVY